MNRNAQLWNQLATLPPGCQIHDNLFVAATVQLLDEAESEERLKEIAGHLKNEQMADCDRETLRKVYRECQQAFERAADTR